MRISRLSTVLVLAVFGLPYLFDVGYCEDVQAPIVWQAALLESEEIDPNEAKTVDVLRDVPALHASFGTARNHGHPWDPLFSPEQTRALQWSPYALVPPRGPPPPTA